MKKIFQKLLFSISLLSFIELFKLFKLSYVFGSAFTFFSINNVFAPMVGVLASSWVGSFFFLFKAILKFVALRQNFWLLAALQFPFIFAALAWNNNKVMTIVSVLAIILFNLHPVGSASFLYSALWLIPLTISLFSTQNIFFIALGSTFIAHAVGSIAWLYLSENLTTINWISLIPLVLFERIVFASGMVLIYVLYNKINIFFKDRKLAIRAILKHD